MEILKSELIDLKLVIVKDAVKAAELIKERFCIEEVLKLLMIQYMI